MGPGLQAQKPVEAAGQAGVAITAFGMWLPKEVQLCTLAETQHSTFLSALRVSNLQNRASKKCPPAWLIKQGLICGALSTELGTLYVIL